MTEALVVQADVNSPPRFTRGELDWLPWLAPLTEADLTPAHWPALVEPGRAKTE